WRSGARLDRLHLECCDRRIQALRVEWHQHLALRVDTLLHRQPQPPRHQGRRQIDVDVVLLEAILVADLDDVAEALGRQQRGLGPRSLDTLLRVGWWALRVAA